MQMFVRKLLNMNEKQDVQISFMLGFASVLLATIIVMFFAVSIKHYEFLMMDIRTLVMIAVIASIINIVIAHRLGKFYEMFLFKPEHIPSKKSIFILSSSATALYIIYFLLSGLFI